MIVRFRIGQIHERNDVEIAVSYVASYGISQIFPVRLEQRIKLWQECRQVFRHDHEIVYERGGAHAVDMLPQHVEALAADDPIFILVMRSLGHASLLV